MAYPPCIINGNAVTKTFQIMYRNEEVRLDDVINFRIHAIVESGKVRPFVQGGQKRYVSNNLSQMSSCYLNSRLYHILFSFDFITGRLFLLTL